MLTEFHIAFLRPHLEYCVQHSSLAVNRKMDLNWNRCKDKITRLIRVTWYLSFKEQIRKLLSFSLVK